VEKTGRNKPYVPKNWTLELVRRVDAVENRTSRAMEFWLENITRDYVTQFSIDYIQDYSVAERYFFKGT